MSEEVLRTHCATLQTMLMSSAKQLHEAEMENARLKADVERLRKAGDAMAREICILGPVDDKEKKAIAEWNAAKEGKQS